MFGRTWIPELNVGVGLWTGTRLIIETIAACEDMDMISASSNIPINLPNDLRLLVADRVLPTMHDLPSENPLESGLPDEFHGLQPQLLAETINLGGLCAESDFLCI